MTAVVQLAAVSFDLPGAVAACGLSDKTIRKAIADGDLVAHYYGTKPVIVAADLAEWIESLPTERARR
jgi:hypothetical protein